MLIGSNPQAISRQDFAHLTPLALPLPSSLLNRRPDIVQAQRQLLAADATLASSQGPAAAVDQPNRHWQHAGPHAARPAR